jgi:Domain of unknown function (DUF4868)
VSPKEEAKALQAQFDKLRQFDYAKASVVFWVIKRRLVKMEASYEAMRVDADAALSARLRETFAKTLAEKNYRLEPYSFVSEDQDEQIYTMDWATTDFERVKSAMDRGFKAPRAKTFKDLLNSWAYVAQLQAGGEIIYAWRKISALNSVKKVGLTTPLLFKDATLVDIDTKDIFTIDTRIDFFANQSHLFILNKKEFESGLNFRARLERARDEVLSEFGGLGLLSSTDALAKKVGSNLGMLRKLSEIQKNGYYKDKNFVEKLRAANTRHHWNLAFDDSGKIIPEDDKIDLLLTLLNNSRLQSLINAEVFDAAVKTHVDG